MSTTVRPELKAMQTRALELSQQLQQCTDLDPVDRSYVQMELGKAARSLGMAHAALPNNTTTHRR